MEAVGISKLYKDADRTIHVLQGIDLKIERAGILAIIGASGVGKSTFLHILGLLDRPTGGKVIYKGEDVSGLGEVERSEMRAREFGFVFQMFHLLPDLTAQENTMLPSLVGRGLFGRVLPHKTARKRSAELLDRMGLGDRLTHKPSELSGGEKQRVAIARALMNEPTILFCDEPTGNLDPATSDETFQLLLELKEERRQTMVIVTHNERLAREAQLVFRMERGKLVPVDLSGAGPLFS